MGSIPDRQVLALRRLAEWEGLSLLDGMLADLTRRPNFFLIAPRVLYVEGVHSDILKWLLDPRGWHGLRDHFASAFVRFVRTRCSVGSEAPITVDEVHREFSTGKGPIDLLLRGRYGDKEFVLGVENKIESPEGQDQLNRYCTGLRLLFTGERHPRILDPGRQKTSRPAPLPVRVRAIPRGR